MPLQLLPLEESEFAAFVEISWQCFGHNLMKLWYPDGPTPQVRESQLQSGLQAWRADQEHIRFMKVIDTELPNVGDLGNIISIAKWRIYPQDRAENEPQDMRKKKAPQRRPSGANIAAINAWYSVVGEYVEKNVGGRASVYLDTFATVPAHQRRGAGTMHLQWGTDLADRLGILCYLEAAPGAVAMYKKAGFEALMRIPIDARDYGVDFDLNALCMLRPAGAGVQT